ncbi:aminoacyl-histidine dipeptidase [Aquimarina sp. 2201CG14-23]|uniref:aminoacyl-histidine dipeptidase n=1 Tax=Aquimarina mycalae TaxID=3040073 RepID=UPI0024780DBF|nr:aminoacyl-histidine dipeptidase [Aquimarina sp. 2201CG14-23]MDH7444275.1 aminoacyl-histidine dipeptidase [Aquimarina sp. 2201CG14-23]
MNSEIRSLEPKELWNKFADLNAVPRPSKKEERVIAFMKDFGNSLGLPVEVDGVGNVLIRKPATAGMENRKTVVMQSHLDMVHQKNADTVFNFDEQGIEMYVDGDWVRAKGTTLGADNGLGVATIMAILESKEISHPPIEALFTIDEETGMTGAMGLKPNWLQGDILLNLDTEEDDEIGVGCAGGVDVTAERSYKEEAVSDGKTGYTISVTGLNGGHSGMDIHKGLGNANKIMNRLLFDGFENFGLRIQEIKGGSLRNAIPRESFATIVVDSIQAEAFEFETAELITTIKKELSLVEPNLLIEVRKVDAPNSVMELGVQEGILKSIYAAHNGVYVMSASIPDLVETSNNIAKVSIGGGKIKVECLTRSSVESTKLDLVNKLRATFELVGCEVTTDGDYPGWAPNMDSSILKVLDELYQKINGERAHIAACHAGLECGILGQNYPEMDMISFGPTILGAHSPDERASISSAKKYWGFVLEILQNIPIKQ